MVSLSTISLKHEMMTPDEASNFLDNLVSQQTGEHLKSIAAVDNSRCFTVLDLQRN
jgi:hypothetical protein